MITSRRSIGIWSSLVFAVACSSDGAEPLFSEGRSGATGGFSSASGAGGTGDVPGQIASYGGMQNMAAAAGAGGLTQAGGGLSGENGGSTPGGGGVDPGGPSSGGFGHGRGNGGSHMATGGSDANAGGGGGSSSGGGSTGGSTGCTPDYQCAPPAPSTGNPVTDCVARVNQFRACVCLPPLSRWTDGEACATEDATYDADNQNLGAHAGAMANICPWGNAQDECPGWRSDAQVISGCLEKMFEEGPPPTTPCTGSCYEQHGHFINMTNTRYTMVACGYYTTTSGQVWGVQNFK